MARFSPAFWRTCLPGELIVPRAEAVMLVVRRSSSTTTPWRVVSWWAVCAQKSARLPTALVEIRPMALRVSALFALPFFCRASFFWSLRWRVFSPGEANVRSWNSPPLVVAATATPRSTPTGAPGWCSGVSIPSSTRKDTNQRPPLRDTVADRIVPPIGREERNLTHPSLGSLARDHLRFSFSTVMRFPAGKRNEGFHRCLARNLTLNVPLSRQERSKSFRVCWSTCEGAALSQGSSALASASWRAWRWYPQNSPSRPLMYRSTYWRRWSRAVFHTARQTSANSWHWPACSSVRASR